MKIRNILYGYCYENGKIVFNESYITNLASKSGSHNYVLKTAEGEVEFAIKVKSESSSTGDSGCSGAIGTTGVLSLVLLAGSVFVAKKRK